MKLLLSIAAVATIASSAVLASDVPANIEAAIANPIRNPENSARDADRKPGEVLHFFGVEEGMTVVDIASGGGYFTEVISGIVGPSGSVRAHNTPSQQFEDGRATLEAHYQKFGNIAIDVVERGATLPYEDNSVDVLLLSLIVHHLHFDEANPDSMPERSAAIYADFKRVLKPGGVFAVIEHTAAPGSSRAESAGWHRAPEEIIKADISSAGFEFDGDADIHVNPDDDLKNVWFEVDLRGKTTRMVHRYVKPD